MSEANQPLADNDQEQLAALKEAAKQIRDEIHKVIIGQHSVIEQTLCSILAQGHVLLEGAPGLAKTLLVSTVAKALNLDFNRIQFTPDLMPSDITGTEIIQEDRSSGNRQFKFLAGPIFANVILADEINRTPPKTQAAMLEAMQEKRVSIGGQVHQLPQPFFVLATQNPIEQEGTYPLPEAQQDRFMLKIFVDYPTYEDEFEIAERTTSALQSEPLGVLDGQRLIELHNLVRRIPVSSSVLNYALRLVRLTRVPHSLAEAHALHEHEEEAERFQQGEKIPEFVREWVSWGAGPRGVQNLIMAAKASAAIDGRASVNLDDIRSMAKPALRHRILTNFAADSEGVTSDHVIDQLIAYLETNPVSTEDNKKLAAAFQH